MKSDDTHISYWDLKKEIKTSVRMNFVSENDSILMESHRIKIGLSFIYYNVNGNLFLQSWDAMSSCWTQWLMINWRPLAYMIMIILPTNQDYTVLDGVQTHKRMTHGYRCNYRQGVWKACIASWLYKRLIFIKLQIWINWRYTEENETLTLDILCGTCSGINFSGLTYFKRVFPSKMLYYLSTC